jgi:hypothetical protein
MGDYQLWAFTTLGILTLDIFNFGHFQLWTFSTLDIFNFGHFLKSRY